MTSKYVRVLLVFLVLMTVSSFALAKLGIPKPHYQVTYGYFSKIGDNWTQIGSKTYHCDGSVTQWGNTTGKWTWSVYEPICD